MQITKNQSLKYVQLCNTRPIRSESSSRNYPFKTHNNYIFSKNLQNPVHVSDI